MPSDKKPQMTHLNPTTGKFQETEKEVVESANALLEMYKAGFLDGYKVKGKVRSKKDHIILNDFYKKAFIKRFEKKINKELKKKKK